MRSPVVMGWPYTLSFLCVFIRPLRLSIRLERVRILALERRGLLLFAQEAVADGIDDCIRGWDRIDSLVMSEAIAFDTYKFVKRLTAHGFTEEQAEVLAAEQVNLLNSNLATKADIEALRLATKADIAGVQQEIETLRLATKADIAGVQQEIETLRLATKADMEALRQATKADIEALRQATKVDIAGVRREIEALKVDLLKWLFGALIAQGGLIVALVKLL